MEGVARWIWCGVTGLMGVLGLFVAAGAASSVGYWGGLAFFAGAVLFVMYQVKLAYDHGETQMHSRD